MNDKTEVVKEITERDFRTGVSSKTNKPWAMHKAVTNQGTSFTTFDDVEPGDTVKLTYNEEYKNWNGAKPRKADMVNDAISEKLDRILEILEGKAKQKASGYEQAKQAAQDLRPQTDVPVTEEFGDYGGF